MFGLCEQGGAHYSYFNTYVVMIATRCTLSIAPFGASFSRTAPCVGLLVPSRGNGRMLPVCDLRRR
eukprot:11174705-Lingulodinium_polyedra.AAC.1